MACGEFVCGPSARSFCGCCATNGRWGIGRRRPSDAKDRRPALTPPFGWALFYIRGVAPERIRTVEIYRGVVPFVLIQLIGLAILAYNPELATWLPSKIFG